jgi:YD repeat-containing protein
MKTDRERTGLRDAVRTVQIATAYLEDRDGQILETPSISYRMRFNQDGQLDEEIVRNPDGSEWRTVNDYSDSSKLLRKRTYSGSGSLQTQVTYRYDSQGRLVGEQRITHDGESPGPTSATYVYDGLGGRTKNQECDFSGMSNVMVCIEGTDGCVSGDGVKRIETRYDRDDRTLEAKAFDATGALIRRVEIVRDARGNPIEEIQYAGDVVAFGTCASEPCSTDKRLTEEENARLVEEVERLFPPGTTISRHVHRYDADGRPVESTLTVMGMHAGRRTFRYDEAGNKSEESSYKEDGSLESKAVFSRQYDDRGNWTEEIVSSASAAAVERGLFTPVLVTRRTITYW